MPIPYRPHFLVFANIDSEASRRYGFGNDADTNSAAKTHLERTLSEFTTLCWTRRQNILKLMDGWSKGRGEAAFEGLPSWYYHPLCYQPLTGHSDSFAIVAIDDFDAYHYLGSVSAKVVEDLTIMLCPDMDVVRRQCLELVPTAKFQDVLCNAETLWNAAEPPCELQLDPKSPPPPGCDVSYRPTIPEAVRSRPLCAVSRCKLEGIFALDLAGWICDKALTALGTRVLADLEKLQQALVDTPGLEGLYNEADLAQTRVVFLHSQGTNEINVLLQGTNATVLGSLMASFRAIQLQDLMAPESPEAIALKQVVDSGMKLPATSENVPDPAQQKRDWVFGDTFACLAHGMPDKSRAFPAILSAPIFRWTLTSLGVATDGLSPCDSFLTGMASAQVLLQFTPAGESPNSQKTLQPSSAKKLPSGFPPLYGHLLGLYDDLRSLQSTGNADTQGGGGWQDLKTLTQSIWESQQNVGRSGNDGLVGLSSLITIPISEEWGKTLDKRITDKEISRQLNTTLGGLLNSVRQAFQNPIKELSELKHKESDSPTPVSVWVAKLMNGSKEGLYDLLRLHLLQEIPKLYGLPLALRHSITCIFQQYVSALTNLHLFDLVVDLLDAFATFHHVLCQILPRHLLNEKEEKNLPSIYITHPLRPELVKVIASYAEALHRALDHRLHRAYPESPIRDMAVDIRGDVYGFIQAAEAPLKCGVGMVANETSYWARQHRRRDLLGVFTNVGFVTGICSVPNNLGIEDKARLGYFSTDVPHLMHVGAYVDYLHEAAHVTLETMVSHRDQLRKLWKDGERVSETLRTLDRLAQLDNSKARSVLSNRLKELFVHSVTYKLLCPGERFLFLRYFISRFSASTENAGFPVVDTIQRFAELFSVLYLATYCLSEGQGNWNHRPIPDFDFSTGIDPMEDDFNKVFDDVAWWYGPYEHALTNIERDAIKKFVRGHLAGWLAETSKFHEAEESSPTVNHMLNLAWFTFGLYGAKVVERYNGVANGSDRSWELSYQQLWDQYLVRVRNAVENGEVFHLHELKSKSQDAGSLDFIEHDAMLICGLLLRSYLNDMSADSIPVASAKDSTSPPRINLPQNPPALDPHLDKNVRHQDFVLLHGSDSRIFLNPIARDKRLLRQISVLRSFWSMTGVFKGRRFCDVLRFAGILDTPNQK